MKNTFSEEFLDAIKAPQNTILITPHDNPDGDALGAAVGLATLLKILHAEASITILITPKAQEDVLSFFDPEKKIAIISQTGTIPDICETADTWYVVDVAVKEKIGLFQESFRQSGAKKICIDHHHNISSGEFDIVHIDPTASASSLLIWELWKALGQDEKIDPKTAEVLYGGIISDTGGWMHTNTESRGMHTGAELLDKGARIENIRDGLRTKKLAYYKLFGRVTERVELSETKNCTIGVSHILASDLEDLGLTENDSDGMIGDFLNVKEINTMICLIEKGSGEFRIRMRSKGGHLNLHEIGKNFSGGGHINAAGGKISNTTLENAKNQILEAISHQANTLG